MLERYFQYQAGLAETKSFLKCPKDCNAPGCWMADVAVEVSLFDLIRLNQALDVSVSNLFFNYCSLGLQAYEPNPRYYRLIIKLKKPCRFLKNTRCEVHGSKPLNCVLFPEYHRASGQWQKLAGNRIFCRFPCINSELEVSDDRSTALKTLRSISLRQEALSYYFLTGLPSFILDSKFLNKHLNQAGFKNRPFTFQDYDRLLDQQLRTAGLLDSIIDKIFQLDTRQGKKDLFEKVNDKTFMQPLVEKNADPEIVHRLKGNRFRPLKRKLQRPEVIFM